MPWAEGWQACELELLLFPGKCDHSRFKLVFLRKHSCSSTDLWGRGCDSPEAWSSSVRKEPLLGLESVLGLSANVTGTWDVYVVSCCVRDSACIWQPFVLITLHIKPTASAQGTQYVESWGSLPKICCATVPSLRLVLQPGRAGSTWLASTGHFLPASWEARRKWAPGLYYMILK